MLERFPDPLDTASQYADELNQRGVNAVLATLADEAQPLMIDGLPCCRECANPILAARLIAKPGACRCIECQSVFERVKR